MKQLAGVSWGVILVVALAWPLVWLLVPTVAAVWAFRRMATFNSGGIAAIGFGLSTLGKLLLLVPPMLLLILRAAAPHVRQR